MTPAPWFCTLWPTHLGSRAVAFYAVLLATFFAIPYSNLFFLGLAFLSVIGAGNVLWALGNLRGVSASVVELPPSPAGHPIPVRFDVACPARPSFLLSGTLAAGGAVCRTGAADLPRGGGVLVGELPALPRGVYAVARARVESAYPHGLLRAGRRTAAPRELVVYPAPVALAPGRRRAALAELAVYGSDGSHGAATLRDWRTGDDPRRVHWKATARRGRLVVRDPDDDDSAGVEIVLDRRCTAPALETALSTIASLALAAAERKERVVLHTQGAVGTYGTGAAATAELLRLLAVLQVLSHDAAPPPVAPTTALRLPEGDGRRSGRAGGCRP